MPCKKGLLFLCKNVTWHKKWDLFFCFCRLVKLIIWFSFPKGEALFLRDNHRHWLLTTFFCIICHSSLVQKSHEISLIVVGHFRRNWWSLVSYITGRIGPVVVDLATDREVHGSYPTLAEREFSQGTKY